ncbi:MAG: heparinase II/III family protein [Clostridia bacterium]|nr:heparinase II/III family protein [Clostridia bacterium]
MRIFKDNGVFAAGKILPHTELRLFLDMKEKKIDPIAKARLLEKAEIALSEPIPVLLLSDYRSYFLTGSRAPFDPRYQRRRTMMVELAMGEYFSQSGRYLEKLCDVIFAILEESSWVLPAHTGHSPECPKTEIPEVYRPDQLHGIDLRSAATATMLAGVYYLVKDRLDTVSPIIAKRIRWETLDRTVRPYLQHEFSWSGAFGGLVNNWCTYCVQAILFCTAVLEEDTERREAVATRAMRHLDNYIAACPPAGGCDEGPGYWEGAAGALFTALEILYDMSGGTIDLLLHPFVAALGAYEPNMYIWSSRFANFADCGPNIFLNAKRLYRYGRRSGVPSLSELARLITAEKLTVPQGRDFFDYAVFYTFLKDLYEEVPTDTAEIRLPRSAWQEDLRIAVFREREDGKGLYFAVKGGHNNESHNHNDVGSFLLYKDGHPVLIDAGSGSYTKKTFSPERYSIWNMSSAYHNLPMIGGYAQKNGAQYKSSEEQFDEEGRRVSMELATAYPKEAPLRSFVRACSMQGARVTVADTLFLSEPSEVQFRFLTTERPIELRPGSVSLPEGMTLSFDPSLSLEITEVQTKDYDPKGAFGADTLWQIRLSGIADEKNYTFIME